MFRIIIVDDEYHIREGLSSYINAECKSFCVSGVFEDGSEALQYIQNHSEEVDVVLTDIRMSDISGIRLAQIIHNEFSHIYVVFISGYTEFEYARKALEFSVVDYLLKPIAFDELESVLLRLEKKLTADNELSAQSEKIENQQFVIGKFLSEVDMGIFCDAEQMSERADELGIPKKLIQNYCAKLCIKRYTGSSTDTVAWHYDINGFDNAVLNGFLDQRLCSAILSCNRVYINVIILAKERDCFREKEDFKSCVEQLFLQSRAQFNQMGCDIEKVFFGCYDNLFELNMVEWDTDIESIIEKIKKILIMNITGEELRLSPESILNAISRYHSVELISSVKDFLGSMTKEPVSDGASFQTVYNDVNEDKSKEIQNQIILKAVQYINQNYQSDISLTEMAERYYMNPSYFGRLFKMHVKESFIDYLIKIRMQKAADLLENTNMKISDVAKTVGYPDLNYFIRLFKRRMGETPGEYRKRGAEYEK